MYKPINTLHTRPKRCQAMIDCTNHDSSCPGISEHPRHGSQSGLRLSPTVLVLLLGTLLLYGCSQPLNQSPTNNSAAQSQNKVPTYVAIGASDTFGIGTSDPYHQNWP